MSLENILQRAQALSKKNWVHAIHILNSAEDEYPNDQRLQIMMADLYFVRLQYSHALTHYLKALSADPGNIKIIAAIASCYLANGEYRLALAYFQRIPNPPEDVLYNTGYTLALLGRHKDCIATMKELLQRIPNHPYVYFVLIEQYYQLGLTDQALHYIKEAEQKAGSQVQTLQLAGLIYSAKELWLPAYYYYQKVEKQGSINNPEHCLRYANAARMIGLTDNAIRILNTAQKRWPYIGEIYTMLLRLLIQEKQMKAAKKVANQAKQHLARLSPIQKILIERVIG
jgi:tetratricopeptide (TPR) repeat protein